MSKYVAYIQYVQWRHVEVEASTYDEAYDIVDDLINDTSEGTILHQWVESGPDEINIEEIVEVKR